MQEERDAQPAGLARPGGHAAVVELLIKSDADFRTPLHDSGFTPVFFAAREGRAEVVRVLLKAGVDVKVLLDKKQQDLPFNTGFKDLTAAGVPVTLIDNTSATDATIANECNRFASPFDKCAVEGVLEDDGPHPH